MPRKVICNICKGTGYTRDVVETTIIGVLTLGIFPLFDELCSQSDEDKIFKEKCRYCIDGIRTI